MEWLRALKKVKRLKKEKKLLWFLMMEGVPSVGSGLYCTVPLESAKYSGVHRILILQESLTWMTLMFTVMVLFIAYTTTIIVIIFMSRVW